MYGFTGYSERRRPVVALTEVGTCRHFHYCECEWVIVGPKSVAVAPKLLLSLGARSCDLAQPMPS